MNVFPLQEFLNTLSVNIKFYVLNAYLNYVFVIKDNSQSMVCIGVVLKLLFYQILCS